MTNLSLINQIFVVLITVMAFSLGAWAYFANQKSRPHQIFLLITIFLSLWIIFCYFGNLSTQPQIGLFLAKLAYGIVALFFIPFYFFFSFFLGEEKRFPMLNKLVLGICALLFLFSISTNLMVNDMEFTKWGYIPSLGSGKFFYFGVVLFLTLFILTRLFIKYFKSSKEEKLKLQYFLVGLFIFITANLIFNVLLPFWQKIPQYYFLGNYSAIFLLGFTAYAIVKKELFGIKVILTDLLVGLMAILLLINILVSTMTLDYVWKGITFLLFCVFGYCLIKATHAESKRKEEAELLAVRERVLRGEAERLAEKERQVAEQFRIVAIQSMAFKQSAEEMAQRERGLRKEAEKLAKIKTEFLILSTHHLRTPATGVKGIISLALEEKYGKISEKMRTALNKVYQSNERAIKLANQLIYASQIDIGEYPPELKEVSLEELLNSLVKEFRIEAEKKNLALRFKKLKEPLPRVFIDEKQLRGVFKNILANAVRYTQQGEIKVWLEKKPETLLTVIKDSGVGIEKDALPVIFEGFAKGKAGYFYQMEGAGLSLYISKRLVEQNKGKIWADSDGKNKGSTFYVELPVKNKKNETKNPSY